MPQRILGGALFPLYIAETETAQRITLAGYINEVFPASLSVAITESADVVAATLSSTFNIAIAITETADSIAATLVAASVAGGSSQSPYQPILTVGRMMGR